MQDTPGDNTPASGSDPIGGPPAAPPPPTPPVGTGKGLIERARDILVRPAAEWDVIDREPATIGGIFIPYVLVLAAIPPIALLIGVMLLGGPFAGLAFNFFLQVAIGLYILSIALVAGLGFAIDALAPSMGGSKNSVQAMKLAAYSHTALWLGGVVLLLLVSAPGLFWLWFLGGFGYGAYLLYLGAPRLMHVPADKAPGFAAAAIGIWFVLWIVLRTLISSMFSGPFGFF
jgi:hypothetical protein